MGPMRRVVLPVLRLIVWSVIAVALCVIAFRQTAPALEATDDGVVAPGADFTDPVVEVGRQSIVNAVELTGSVQPVAAVEVKAPENGTAVYFAMPSGRYVENGEPLMTLRRSEEREPLQQTDAEGNVTTVERPPVAVDSTAYANASGEITFTVAINDEVSKGDVIARIDPQQSYIAAAVPAALLYRLISLPATAEVTITNGPAPFECGGLRLETLSGETGASTQLRCDIPADVVVFPGLEVNVSVVTATVDDALVVPLTSVLGSYEAGSVWLVGADGVPVETPVALGLNDGEHIQVVEGLAEGDTVLQFVPGADPTYPDDGSGEGDGEDGGEG